jgi:hypothetical protein
MATKERIMLLQQSYFYNNSLKVMRALRGTHYGRASNEGELPK